MSFPRRIIPMTPRVMDGDEVLVEYSEITIGVLANPTQADIDNLLAGRAHPAEDLGLLKGDALKAAEARMAERRRLGEALVSCYDGAMVEAYGHRLDFSTPDAAVETINNPKLPADLAYWLLNVPWEVHQATRANLGKSLASSLTSGRASTK